MTIATATLTPGAALDFEQLAATERPRLERLATRLVWDTEEAKDLVQAALAQAWEQRARLDRPSSAAAWLRRIVVHRAMSLLRRRRVWRVLGTLLLVPPEHVPLGDETSEQAEHLSRLAAALDRLPPRQSAAFSLRYLEGLSIDEVAAALAIDRGTVRVHLQRAVKALRAGGVLSEREPA